LSELKKRYVSITGSVSALRQKHGKTGTELGLKEGAQNPKIESSLSNVMLFLKQ
jgi:hypothetical protein